MQVGMIGLGRMGMNMVRRLLGGKHEVVVYNRTQEKVKQMEAEGAIGSRSLEDIVHKLLSPRVLWIMLPAGRIVDETIKALLPMLSPGDIIVDGGNTNFKDDIRRAEELKPSSIHYVDAGISGGVWGLQVGYCTMIGGDEADFKHIEPLLETLAPRDGYLYCGPTGSGHFVKMVHNGIEYGVMEAYGEGFEMLKASPYGEQLDLQAVARLWNQGSVIRSWLLELLELAFGEDPDLSSIKGYVEDSGEGRWTVQEAVELGVSVPVIALSLFKRFQSRQPDLFSDKVLAALRNQFGGHAVVAQADEGRGEREKVGKGESGKTGKRENEKAGKRESGKTGKRESGKGREWEREKVGKRENGKGREWERGKVGKGESGKTGKGESGKGRKRESGKTGKGESGKGGKWEREKVGKREREKVGKGESGKTGKGESGKTGKRERERVGKGA